MKQDRVLSVRSVTEIALCAALIAVTAMISIPFPVPFTLQLFGVYFALFYLGGARGSLAVFVYIAIGAVGLPVLSGLSGGVGRLFDATGGFIFGFLLLSLVYLLCERLISPRRFAIVGSVLSLVAFYAIGSIWYSAFYVGDGASAYFASLLVSVAPFVLPDAVKICLAYLVTERLLSIFRKKSPQKQKND